MTEGERRRTEVRFGLRSISGAHSAVWKLWCNPQEGSFYLGARSIAGAMKVSLHRSGDYRIAFTRTYFEDPGNVLSEETERVVAQWGPEEPIRGWHLGVRVVVPWFEVRQMDSVDAALDVQWVSPPAVGHYAVFSVMIGEGPDPGRPEFRFPRPAAVIGSVQTRAGSVAALCVHHEPLARQNWEMIQRIHSVFDEVLSGREVDVDEDVKAQIFSKGEVVELSPPQCLASDEDWHPRNVTQRFQDLDRIERAVYLLGQLEVRSPIELSAPSVAAFGAFARVGALAIGVPHLVREGVIAEAALLVRAMASEADYLVEAAGADQQARHRLLLGSLIELAEARVEHAQAHEHLQEADRHFDLGESTCQLADLQARIPEWTRAHLDSPDYERLKRRLWLDALTDARLQRLHRAEFDDRRNVRFVLKGWDPEATHQLCEATVAIAGEAARAFAQVFGLPEPEDLLELLTSAEPDG